MELRTISKRRDLESFSQKAVLPEPGFTSTANHLTPRLTELKNRAQEI
jgi:hypothetical protein